MRTPSLVPACILLFASCATEAATPERFTVRDSAGITIVESLLDQATPFCTVGTEPTVTIGTTEGAPEHQLYRTFGAARLGDGRMAVVNQGSQELRFYDSTGVYLGASGGAGDGPGEFRNMFTLAVLPGDTLWVGDQWPWSWEVFAPDGQWVRSAVPTPLHANRSSAGVLDDGRTVVVPRIPEETPVGRFVPRRMIVLLHAADGTLQDTIGVYEDAREGKFEDVPMLVISPLFESAVRMVAGGSNVILARTSTPELRVHEVADTVRLVRIIRWSAEPRRVTSQDVAAERDRIRSLYSGDEYVEPLTRDARPVATHLPLFSSLVRGRDGRIWVRGYRHPAEESDDEWLIFGAEGELQCRLIIEPFEQLPEFGSDYILVMKRDELDVERIYLYALREPEAGE